MNFLRTQYTVQEFRTYSQMVARVYMDCGPEGAEQREFYQTSRQSTYSSRRYFTTNGLSNSPNLT